MVTDESANNFVRSTDDVADAFRATLRDVMSRGNDVVASESLSVGSGKKTREIANYLLSISNPRERLTYTSINLPGAVARFVWMMAANNRLKDIEFYWGNKVARFSDDRIIVPGSSYGERMLHPRPGLNQIEGIIDRLKKDPGTRRAAVSIYQAEDAIRESNDIPCAFGIFFHVRNGHLQASVVMRSNNAVALLPYNLFEFSLLAECVAAELKLPLGTLSYFAVSMHVYEESFKTAEELGACPIPETRVVFPKIPTEPSPISQVKELVRLEADARHAAAGFTAENFDEWFEGGGQVLNSYWRQLYYLLLLEMATKRKLQYALDKLERAIAAPWKEQLKPSIFSAGEKAGAADLFGKPISEIHIDVATPSFHAKRLASLEGICERESRQLREQNEQPLTFEDYRELRKMLVGSPEEPLALAAQGLGIEITEVEFRQAFERIRNRR